MVEYKYYYFDFRGLGELVRLVFAATGQKFEDVRIPRDKWPEWKHKTPFGKLPYLEVIDGSNSFTLSQSKAISRFLARNFGLAGKNEKESAIIDMYGDQLGDFFVDLGNARREENEKKRNELEEKLQNEILPANLKFFEDRLAKSGSGYITSGLSWADLFLYNMICVFSQQKEQILKQYKHIKVNYEKVESHPGVAHWLKTRPVTEF